MMSGGARRYAGCMVRCACSQCSCMFAKVDLPWLVAWLVARCRLLVLSGDIARLPDKSLNAARCKRDVLVAVAADHANSERVHYQRHVEGCRKPDAAETIPAAVLPLSLRSVAVPLACYAYLSKDSARIVRRGVFAEMVPAVHCGQGGRSPLMGV